VPGSYDEARRFYDGGSPARGGTVRASTITAIIIGIAVGLFGLVLGIFVFADHSGGKLWFYWIAPLLAIGFFTVMAQLAVGYWVKVGRLETKGRPRK
jgi:H+/Cl- antiporter ClcA